MSGNRLHPGTVAAVPGGHPEIVAGSVRRHLRESGWWGQLITAARRSLRRRVGPEPLRRFSEPALAGLESHLLERLEEISAPVLALEYARFRTGQQLRRMLSGSPPEAAGTVEADPGLAFRQRLKDDHAIALGGQYPALLRLSAALAAQWATAGAEFILRLHRDWPLLQTGLARLPAAGRQPRPVTQVAAIAAGLSDPHHGGRTVIELTFDNRQKLIYKPRNLQIDAAFNRFLAWVNAHSALGDDDLLKSYSVLDRGDYGWSEHVTPSPCRSEAEWRCYYRRCGRLLGLLYVFDAVDCHFENVIAAGPHPLLIDRETLLHPRLRGDLLPERHPRRQPGRGMGRHGEAWENSVLRSGFLPGWLPSPRADRPDISGLAGGHPPAPAKAREMLSIHDIEEMVGGFRQVYRFLQHHKAFLLSPRSPLEVFSGVQTRFIFRSSFHYVNLLRQAYDPSRLKSGRERRAYFDRLRGYLQQKAAGRAVLERIYAAELRSLEKSDIPVFNTVTTENVLRADGEVIAASCFEQPGFERLRRNIERLSEQDLARQSELIRGAFARRRHR